MEINRKIFKAYDIRGKYPKEIDERAAYLIGKGIGTLYPNKKVVVGFDVRLSSPSLKDNLIKGLLEAGEEIVEVGMLATPMIYFACYKLGYDLGLMVTASHLTKEFNGIKVCDSRGMPIGYENGLNKVLEIIEKGEFREGEGKLTKRNINEEYANFMKKFARNYEGIKIIVDGANGSAGRIYSKILKGCNATVEELYCEPDGNFPNHTPDPMNKEFIVDLERKVKEGNFDLGFAFDCDGDRLNIVNERGEVVNTNHVFSLLIENELKNKSNEKVVHDILSSKLIDDVVKENGGIPIACKVGHMYIANKCLEENAIMAGEVSGHYYFRETNYADDVLIACIKILNILKESGKKLSELTSKYPKYYTYSSREKIKEDEKFKFIENLKEKLKAQSYDLITLDGVRVNFRQGWLVVRASNTEAKISVAFESSDKEEFEKIKKLADEIIKEIPR